MRAPLVLNVGALALVLALAGACGGAAKIVEGSDAEGALDDGGATASDGTGAPGDLPIAVDAPQGATVCQGEIAALGVAFTPTQARGVVDAVKLLGPLDGVLFATGTATTVMTDPVACQFVKTLYNFAGLLKSRGFVRAGTLGSYCYRCCCAWSTTNSCRTVTDPEPDCSANGYSTHSWGRAIDVRYLYKADGTRYDVRDNTHFAIYTSGSTCTSGLAAQPTGSISRTMYQLACDATKMKIFGTVLTPNYNSAHRDHFHMDIGEKGTPSSNTTSAVATGGTDVARAGSEDECGGE